MVVSGEAPASEELLWLPDDASADALESYWRGAEPGWYADPDRTDVLRYWDGRGWTEVVTPRSFSGGLPPPPPHSGGPTVRERVVNVVQRIRQI